MKNKNVSRMKPRDFIGQKATYDAYGQIIWGGDANKIRLSGEDALNYINANTNKRKEN